MSPDGSQNGVSKRLESPGKGEKVEERSKRRWEKGSHFRPKFGGSDALMPLSAPSSEGLKSWLVVKAGELELSLYGKLSMG